MPKARAGSFGDDLRRGTGYGGEQPVKAAFARMIRFSQTPLSPSKLIMPLGDTQDFVYRLDPFPSYPLLSEHRRKYSAQCGAEPPAFRSNASAACESDCGRLRS